MGSFTEITIEHVFSAVHAEGYNALNAIPSYWPWIFILFQLVVTYSISFAG
jgi:hypothetical protein